MSPASSCEHVERRILGGLQLVDVATRMPIRRPMHLRMDPDQNDSDRPPDTDVRLLVNRSSRYAILGASGLEAHVLSDTVAPDDAGVYAPRPGMAELGAPRSYRLRVDDPLRRYLPRRFTLKLPRDPDVEHAEWASSVYQPRSVQMLPAPVAVGSPGWSVLRARVHHAAHPELGLPFAIVRVERGGMREALGMTDGRGEALVFVTSLPARDWGQDPADPISTLEIRCRVEAAYDPTRNPLGGSLAAALRRVADREALEDPESTLRAVDPIQLEAGRGLHPRHELFMNLSAGRTQHVELPVNLDPLD